MTSHQTYPTKIANLGGCPKSTVYDVASLHAANIVGCFREESMYRPLGRPDKPQRLVIFRLFGPKGLFEPFKRFSTFGFLGL